MGHPALRALSPLRSGAEKTGAKMVKPRKSVYGLTLIGANLIAPLTLQCCGGVSKVGQRRFE